jgi:hypothetical protein
MLLIFIVMYNNYTLITGYLQIQAIIKPIEKPKKSFSLLLKSPG